MGSNGKYILMNDIDLSGVEWTAKSLVAGAEFNGNGYAIKNTTKNIFATNNGTIKNVFVKDVNGEGTTSSGLVATNSSTGVIENCSASGNIKISSSNAGGIAAVNNGRMKNCSSFVVIDQGGLQTPVGGLVGTAGATSLIENCYSNSEVKITPNYSRWTGGLIGHNSGVVNNCRTEGTVAGNQQVGGLIGYATETSNVKNSESLCTVSGTDSVLGGLIGNNFGSIESSTFNGRVEDIGTGWGSTVGGLVGQNQSAASIYNCKVSGDVIGTSVYVGGIAASNAGKIEKVSVDVNVKGTTYIGGVVGINSGSIKDATAKGSADGEGDVGMLVGNNSGNIENAKTSGVVTGTTANSGGLVGNNSGVINNTFSNCDVVNKDGRGWGANAGGLVGKNTNKITNSSAAGNIETIHNGGGLVGLAEENSIIENVAATGNVTATGGNPSGGLIGINKGYIKNATASGNVSGAGNNGGLVGQNETTGTIKNVKATGNVTATGNYSGGLIGRNGGIIVNAAASGYVNGKEYVGGLVGGYLEDGAMFLIENCNATGNVFAEGSRAGGLVGWAKGTINNSYALGNVTSLSIQVGGLVGRMDNTTINNSYAKGEVKSELGLVAGLVGYASGVNNYISSSYSTGNIEAKDSRTAGFLGGVDYNSAISINDSYSSGTVNKGYAFVGPQYGQGATITNSYSNSEQFVGIVVEQNGVTAMPASWFEESYNLMFLGDAYDYYYNPPELWGNYEEHPEEFTQFQVGANSGLRNQLDMNLQFRMYNFYGDVSSVDAASATLDRVDAFKDRLTEHRSMIGAVRNRLDSVLESQSIRLENLNSSHSTIVDTDFAAETAKLTRNQILQQATSSLLSQANFMPNIALQLLQ